NSESPRQIYGGFHEMARRKTPIEAALARGSGAAGLCSRFDNIFCNLFNVRLCRVVHLVHVPVEVCRARWLYDVFDCNVEKNGCGILERVACGRDTRSV